MNVAGAIIMLRRSLSHFTANSILKLQLKTSPIAFKFSSLINRQKIDVSTQHFSSSWQQNGNKSSSFICMAGLTGVAAICFGLNCLTVNCEEDNSAKEKAGRFVEGLPIYTEKQVLEHNKGASTIWVIYKEGVYDITEFIEGHPGGPEKIVMAAGTSIEPFWQVYPVHYDSPDAFERLEMYRIGNLKRESSKPVVDSNDPFANEPKRHPALKVLSQKPFNAESPKEISVENLVTPNDLHFVRSHLPVPVVDMKSFRLEIVDETTGRRVSFTMDQLTSGRLFPIYTIPVTLQCSGNKRKFMHSYEPVQGLMWDVNAISNAEWTGVKLRDVLDYCKIDLKNEKVQEVHFDGLDIDPSGSPYSTSVPKERVSKEPNDVLLAFKMNGVDIPPDHGYPLRAIVPGVTGARSVKWLQRVVVSSEESKGHWHKNDYKLISPCVKELKDVDFTQYKPIQESAVQSAICQPVEGAKIDRDERTFVVKGYAFSGGGNAIEKVIVSIDDGKTWKVAKLNQVKSAPYRHWSWTIWECEMEIPEGKDSVEIVCVATDSQTNTQPETVKAIWNIRGLMNNAWHRVKVEFINT